MSMSAEMSPERLANEVMAERDLRLSALIAASHQRARLLAKIDPDEPAKTKRPAKVEHPEPSPLAKFSGARINQTSV